MKPAFWMVLLVLVLIAMLSGCEREERRVRAELQEAGPTVPDQMLDRASA